ESGTEVLQHAAPKANKVFVEFARNIGALQRTQTLFLGVPDRSCCAQLLNHRDHRNAGCVLPYQLGEGSLPSFDFQVPRFTGWIEVAWIVIPRMEQLRGFAHKALLGA